jgi:hypothetical protein
VLAKSAPEGLAGPEQQLVLKYAMLALAQKLAGLFDYCVCRPRWWERR